MALATSTLDPHLVDRLRKVRLLALDVDGVLTDGRLYFQADGVEIKAFHTQDGLGLKLLRRAGLQVAFLTGRESPMVSHRAAALGIDHVYQSCEDKLATLRELCTRRGIELEQVAYCGDDLPDLAAIQRAGIGITVPNTPPYIRDVADYVTERSGGHGAVREICDLLLEAQGHRDALVDTYLHGKR
ncbi:HAD hydrolase family protein [Halomonas sp. MCCC 1A17488]|uniref:3-deoxy-D-manno-octulosonate 8-phosphate phosphatase KdsC n=1 Tax=Billgrantia sulfidoxydans TaxID=2733484 RepID=A0ABX7W7N1_9GAMM|nr:MULTISPECIES: HAD hydrolase family protein [Halomonas]MCE8014613.1 HAD hydrolase family protein [Halomonas sp. MCCC 1A17488]MCG3237946.1 HAD hydrolase family protein [Halomonas sp. MCCC 1A17488]QPP48270.1 HAD hydrolase family protein [Halomonas sp. SS10-MC5]QTP55572.1 HAD hydrolase family protein [Halomonas sulfidoxydans]